MTDDLAATVRAVLTGVRKVREVKMFGGIGFMLGNHLLVAASPRGLLVRVGKERYSEALLSPGTEPMIMRGRAMEGYVRVESEQLDPRGVASWVELAIAFVKTLPPKVPDAKRKRQQRVTKKPVKSSARRR
jgi:TfoX/Sxy family transcriptional regulator of competence genes